MLFNSLDFLFLFLPITYFFFWRTQTKQQRFVWLTITGYVFYSFWNFKFCGLMLFSTLVSYFAGLGFLRYRSPGARRALLTIPIVIDLLLLGFFKYFNFLSATVNDVAFATGIAARAPLFDIVLPVGISFYTFHTITYIVDSYRNVITPTRNFFEFSCYVSLFAQLVAGPIVRFREIEKDLDAIDHPDRAGLTLTGTSFFVLGLAKKVLLADTIASVIDPALANWQSLSTSGAWLCAIGYSYQLYFDFSGYSDMAVGLGMLFGLRLPQNFNSPYQATDIADFWRRWHISLSSVMRDYLFIPLGGSRVGTFRLYTNLMLTMLIGGLWHGAGWNFIIWGAFHGFGLCLTRAFSAQWAMLPAVAQRVLTFSWVLVGWVFFRALSMDMALGMLNRMFTAVQGSNPAGLPVLAASLLCAFCLAHFGKNTFELSHRWKLGGTVVLTLLFAVSVLAIYARPESPFLYFQF
jgi:alginate O-acetyltransferase complex protein AlgI